MPLQIGLKYPSLGKSNKFLLHHCCTLLHLSYDTLSFILIKNPMLNKFKITLAISVLMGLFACTPITPKHQKTSSPSRFLKENITQSELNKAADYKRYYYVCNNLETGGRSSLTTYFPLSRESRKKENFGFYFQLDGHQAVPFDHIENKELNARGSRFEVIYQSYNPIEGSMVELIARQHSSIYYKNHNGFKTRWLSCKGG